MNGTGCYHDNILLNDYGPKSKYEYEYEFLYIGALSNLKDIRKSLTQWFDWYNQERFHQGP
ncbi:integrase core domain-containing protein [Nitrosomonas ureae]|uniref:integrase core domain-containing protein n=1 Tax=Nitrosomonas ureae TaxID=44577 RepID=UPI0026912ABA